MILSKFRGHEVFFDHGVWCYSDSGEVIDYDNPRPCKKCGRIFRGSNIGDADPCLGELPGVDNACCGHGDREQSYIRFTNGVTVTGFTVNKIEDKK